MMMMLKKKKYIMYVQWKEVVWSNTLPYIGYWDKLYSWKPEEYDIVLRQQYLILCTARTCLKTEETRIFSFFRRNPQIDKLTSTRHTATHQTICLEAISLTNGSTTGRIPVKDI
jgi:hypothetical protein